MHIHEPNVEGVQSGEKRRKMTMKLVIGVFEGGEQDSDVKISIKLHPTGPTTKSAVFAVGLRIFKKILKQQIFLDSSCRLDSIGGKSIKIDPLVAEKCSFV